jgi:hypothetical protein
MSDSRFPNEPAGYRDARVSLLAEEAGHRSVTRGLRNVVWFT